MTLTGALVLALVLSGILLLLVRITAGLSGWTKLAKVFGTSESAPIESRQLGFCFVGHPAFRLWLSIGIGPGRLVLTPVLPWRVFFRPIEVPSHELNYLGPRWLVWSWKAWGVRDVEIGFPNRVSRRIDAELLGRP